MTALRHRPLPFARGLAVTLLVVGGPLAAQTPPTLEGVLRRALAVHPTLAAAAAATDAARADLETARAARFPRVSLDGSLTRFQEPMLVAPLHRFDPGAISDFDPTLIRGTVGAAYTVFDGGRRSARVAQAAARRDASEAGQRVVTAGLLQKTAEAYLAVLSAQDVVRAQARRESALTAEVDRARQLLTEGAVARVELLRAQAELSSVQADGEAARQGLDLTLTTLGRLIDRSPDELRQVSLDEPALPTTPVPDLVQTGSSPDPLLDDAPAVRRSRFAVRAAEAAARSARGAWLPSVSAALAYNVFAGWDAAPVAEWQAGVRLSYPLFTGGARSGGVERARADEARARADVRTVRKEVAQAADAARTAEVEARARVQALEAAVDRFTELARVERLALDEGAGTQSDWLRAEAGLFQARAGLADARYAVLRARIAWARALGRLDLDWIDTMEMTP